jgi:hypothetical protein
MDTDVIIAEILANWPKKRDNETVGMERSFLELLKDDGLDLLKVKEMVEVKIEDTASVGRLPPLCTLLHAIRRQSGVGIAPPMSPLLAVPDVTATGLYSSPIDNTEAINIFDEIYSVWPQNPGFTERKENAQAAFLTALRVFPLKDLKTSCHAYADSFGDGSSSQTYAKSLKNFVSDRDLVKHWLDFSTSRSCVSDIDKQHFAAAYAWYPEFSNKKSPKVRDSSWVKYWRHIKPEERLDFMSYCQEYAKVRRNETRVQELNSDESTQYTKSFSNFVSDWRYVFEGRRIVDAKADFCSHVVISLCIKNDLDVVNIWGPGTEGPFFYGVLGFYFGSLPTIKDAILAAITKTLEVVKTKIREPETFCGIQNLALATKQVATINPVEFANRIYKVLMDTKLVELPRKKVE